MAEIRYIDLGLLTKYDEQIKAHVEALITAANGDIAAVQALVDTLVADDANKSVRTIANEELAKQLIPENAAEALDTLKEIADWIQAHPGEASAMNTAIGENKAAIETEAGRADTAEKALAGRLDVIEGEGEGSVKKALGDANDYTDGLKDTVVTNTASSTDGNVTVTLGGTVGAPTVSVSHNFVPATEAEILALFAEKEEAGE